MEEAFDMELVTRFLVLVKKEPEQLQRIDELGAYLNYACIEQARDTSLDRDAIEEGFCHAFDFLSGALEVSHRLLEMEAMASPAASRLTKRRPPNESEST